MIILYTTNCPQCNILKRKLESKHITFSIVELTNEQAIEKGFTAMPMMDKDGILYNFTQSIMLLSKL